MLILIDQPGIASARRIKTASSKDIQRVEKSVMSEWPSASVETLLDQPEVVSSSDFQKLYVDILPEPWTAISLKLNDSKEDLFIIKYRKGESPFILRVPLMSHNYSGEEQFGYQDGRE